MALAVVSMLSPRFGLTRRRLRSRTAMPFFDMLEVLGLDGRGSSGLRMDVATVDAMVAVLL